MWARVKAETETAVLTMGFRDAYALRPGFIQPMRGAQSRNRWMRWVYALFAPLYPMLHALSSRLFASTDLLAAAMLRLASTRSTKKTLNTGERNAVAREG